MIAYMHGRPQGGTKLAFAPPLENGTKNQKFLENFARMTLILHKSQVHCSGFMQ